MTLSQTLHPRTRTLRPRVDAIPAVRRIGWPQIGATLVILAAMLLAACTPPPVSLAQRALEARSNDDIKKDTIIFASVSKEMASYATFAPTSLVYEQDLLLYGIMENAVKADALRQEIAKIPGVKNLHWHVITKADADAKKPADQQLNAAEILRAKGSVEANWLKAGGVASLNFRVGVDALGNAYLMGKAASSTEKNAVEYWAKQAGDVTNVVSYVKLN